MKSKFIKLSLICWWAWAISAAPASEQNQQEVPVEKLTMATAIARVLEKNPELAASGLEIQAASARIQQAGLRLNPEITAEIQNLPEFWAHDLFHTTEFEVSVSQRLETGGKRALRVQAAGRERDVAGSTLTRLQADLLASARLAFLAVLANQERLENSRQLARLAEQSHAVVAARVAAGRASPVEQTRSAVTLATIRLEAEKQAFELVASKDRLAALWGGASREFDRVDAPFQIPVASTAARACIESSPDMALAGAIIDSRSAELELEQAMKKPDLTLSAGYRRSNPEMYNAWFAGFSIPIPWFDKRQGSIAQARRRLEQASLEKRAVERRLRSRLVQARHDLETAIMESASLLKTTLPEAAEALAATEEGYRLGKFEYLNVLDAQRTYAELERRNIEAVASGMKAAVEMDRFAGCASMIPYSKERRDDE
jgi:cobalt-zinc-cadmium efflux system outer membrane protein